MSDPAFIGSRRGSDPDLNDRLREVFEALVEAHRDTAHPVGAETLAHRGIGPGERDDRLDGEGGIREEGDQTAHLQRGRRAVDGAVQIGVLIQENRFDGITSSLGRPSPDDS